MDTGSNVEALPVKPHYQASKYIYISIAARMQQTDRVYLYRYIWRFSKAKNNSGKFFPCQRLISFC